ncbi:hypothetical protein [Photorhabdus hindustanensis]|uniref:Uncharacterized protein n=1 Tax=Photorhabdus hindustanensis TaxID=2918802 RepID=A0A2S8Q1N0_9GAMM|nr:hypothetical protein [Photorhabdus hindustanensis]PQQ25698.1 hypothetical protein C6H66_11490 [Photorhabdus hindustanensis]
MASIVSEYQRFLDYLTQQDVPDDIRRLAHLILNHLQPLAEVDLPIAYEGNADAPEAGSGLGRLHQLEVGPFRGFMRQEIFDHNINRS